MFSFLIETLNKKNLQLHVGYKVIKIMLIAIMQDTIDSNGLCCLYKIKVELSAYQRLCNRKVFQLIDLIIYRYEDKIIILLFVYFGTVI